MNQLPAMQFHDSSWFALSASQRANWFLYQFDAISQGNLNNTFAARLRGRIDAACIGTALQSIVARHPMLRACFGLRHGKPMQAIAPAATLQLTEIDCTALSPQSLRDRIESDCRQPFDLTNPPLIRASLYWQQEQEAVLVLVSDHIVVDGWSYWQILSELETELSTPDEVACRPAPLADYRSYIAWQDEWLASADGIAQLTFWKQELSGDLPVLQLPFDRLRLPSAIGVQQQISITLPTAMTARLHALATSQACTLYTVLLTAYQILLHRHTGHDEIIVGSPLPARPQERWDRVVGDFVNPVALRTVFAPEQTVTSLLRQVRGTAARAMANQEYPFSLLVEKLQPVRLPDEHPIFQTTFVMHRAGQGSSLLGMPQATVPTSPVTWGNLDVSPFPVRQSGNIAHIPLELEAIEADGQVLCAFKFDVDLLDASTIERWAGHFTSLLEGMISDPCQEIDRLAMLGPQERRQLLVDLNTTGEPYQPQHLLHALFEQHAARQPEAIAAVCDGQTLSYAQLNLRANHLAHALIALGVKPEQRVAICMERSLGLLVGIIGILKSGAAYVPLDPAYPLDRMEYMLNDCTPLALVTQSSLLGAVPQLALPVKLLDANGLLATDVSTASHDTDPDSQALGLAPHHLAYVIYTSGSTGMPKGVMIEHGNVPRIFGAAQRWLGFDETDTWSMFHSSAFDFSVWEIWGALLHGGKLVIVPSDTARSPGDFYTLLCRERVTVLSQTPGAFRQVLSAQEQLGLSHTLRRIIFAGEALELHAMDRWFQQNDADATMLVNMYGATESTVHATVKHITPADVAAQLRGCCGKPIPGYGIYILDKHLQPVPLGMAGEIYIGGPCVSRGYMNRPELNAERFIPNHLTNQASDRLYKTGDLGRWLATGDLDYLGRNDFQVKIRGFRIELGEIEARLAAICALREVVVVAREDQPGGKRLVAYLVPKDGDHIVLSELRQALSRILPEYMVPSAFVVLGQLPLTPNGKLDRKALPVPDSTAVATQAYEAPLTPVEISLASMWQSILGVNRVGRSDNFFELGGHSLLAIQLVQRLRDSFSIDLPLKVLFEHPVLGALAGVVDQARLACYATADMAALEAELNGLSEQELRAILSEQA